MSTEHRLASTPETMPIGWPIILLQKLNLLIKWHSQTDGGWCEQIADAVGARRIGLVIYARQQERDDNEDDGDEQRVHQRPSVFSFSSMPMP